MDETDKIALDEMAKELTLTDTGRGITLAIIIQFSKAHIVNVKAWYENSRKEKK